MLTRSEHGCTNVQVFLVSVLGIEVAHNLNLCIVELLADYFLPLLLISLHFKLFNELLVLLQLFSFEISHSMGFIDETLVTEMSQIIVLRCKVMINTLTEFTNRLHVQLQVFCHAENAVV